MPVHWKYILSINPEELNDEEKDELFNTVAWFDSDKEEPDLVQTKVLLRISQEILKYKGEQVETLLHELDEIAIKQGEEEARKFESDVELRSARSRKSSTVEIENLEQKYNEMKTKYKKQQRINQKNLEEIEVLTKNMKSLELEKRQLEHDLASKMDGSESSEMSDTVKDQHKELIETVHNKNKQLSDLLHDIEEVEKENILLREKLAHVRDELAVATSEIQSQTDKLSAFDIQLRDSNESIKKLTIDNELLQEDIQELSDQKTKQEERMAEFTEEINKRIEDWQKVLEEKDDEIRDLKSRTTEIGRSSSSSSMLKQDQPHLAALQKLLSERDSQLMEVQSKLEVAVHEMEASTDVIEELKREKEEKNKTIAELNAMRKELKKQLKVTHERAQKLQEEVDYAEKITEEKSLELQNIISHLENSDRLDDAQALKELRDLRAQNRMNEKQIMSLVKNVNKLQDTCDQMMRENSFLREKMGIPEEDSLTLPNYQSKHKQYKKELLRLKKKVLHFEEENINLRTEVKNLNRINYMLREDISEGDRRGEQKQDSKTDVRTRETETGVSLDEPDEVAGADLSLSLGEIIAEQDKNSKDDGMVEEQIKALCEENEALRKGMHEILNSLNSKKESSLKEIKSETFEKLLRALDVKHISGWYHPAMRLQAEVHNVEGINQELREQLRICRLELEEVRNEKQESLILLSKRSSVSSPRHLAQSSTLKDMRTLESLNENVDQLLERSSLDAKVCEEIATKMNDFNEDFAALEKQLENLYEQSMQEKKTYEDTIAKLEKKNSQLERQIQTLDEQLKIFMEDIDVEDTTKKIAELTGKNVEAELKRDYLEEECNKLQEKVEGLKKDLLEAEFKCSKTLLEVTRNDKTLRNKIRSMESRIETTISLEDHQKLKKNLENLTVKYRELTEDYKKLGENHQMEMDLIQRSKQMTEEEKQELKDRLSECLSKLKASVSEEAVDEKLQNLSKQLSECEVNMIGEKQRANHINNLYELVKEQLNKSEERFKEYENHTKDIMHKNLALQGQLKEVEDKMCECVQVELYNASKEDYQKVLERENELLELIAKLQEERNASEMNQKSVAIWTSSKEEELLSLKHQVVDLLSVSDDKAVIARMGSDLMQTRMREEELKKKCEVLSVQLEQCHDEWLDSLRVMDEEKEKFDMKEKYLQKKNRIIRDLLENQKLQYYGCIPLTSEQRFIENIRLTLENNHASFLSLYKAQNVENDSLALKEQAEVELRHYMDAKEIMGQNEEEVQKLLNWLQEKKHVELELIRYRRQADFKELQLQQCNARIEIQNEQIAKLEEDLFLSFKDPDSVGIVSSFIQPKLHPEPVPEISEKHVKLTRSQDVQTEMVEVDGTDNDAKRLENLKTELLNMKNELLAKEEAIQQLKTKLNECEMTVSLFRSQIGDKQAQINFYEKHILELQASMKEENGLQKGQTDSGGGGDGASNEAPNEEVMSLKASIKALQEAIALKDESILHYQSLIKEDRDNHSLAAARMQEELKTLKNTVAEEKQKRLEFEEQKEEEASRSKAAVDQYIKQVHAMEQHADELHTQVSTLESQLVTSRQEAVRWRSLANDRLKGIEDLRQNLEEQHNEELEIYKKDSDKWRHEVLSLKDLINKHKNEILQVQPDLQNLLKSKDEKINELTSLVRQLREKVHIETQNDIYNKLTEFEKAYEQLSKEHEILKKKFDSMLQKERNAREEIRDLRGQLLKTKRTPSSARSEKSDKSIKDQLQKKISTLEDEVARLKEELATQVAVNETHKVKAAEDFDRWKKQKQSQQTIDKLKSKLKERDGEFEKIQHTCNGYRSLIERLEREKHSLENRVKALKTNVNIYGFENAQQNDTAAVENARLLSEIEELKAKLEMQQRHAGGLGAAMMQEKLEAQERKLAIMELSGKGTPEIRGELERLQSTISNLQKSNLFLEAQNIELKMDLDKSQKDFSRFKEQIQHLENYIEVLKKEKSQVPSHTSGGSQTGQSSQESRRVSELERTVLVLKRVVEKLQTENKRLLSGKRPLADRTLSGDKLRKDFNSLKDQYNESVHKISELESVLNATKSKLKAYEDGKYNTEDFLALSTELNRVRGQLDQKSQLLDKVKTLLHTAAAKEKVLLKEISDLKMKLYRGDPNLAQPSTSYG
ncbi:centrosomal protein of 290 kDa [Harmonia axyridis]|uniref:centrosomal protein of 290 kDa n=1 Tax=Harmonia axyridis TaxID=115357 RepID=UPI001E278C37|nr:centrosomal protein of 290 kDa [Harmonia axyridis]